MLQRFSDAIVSDGSNRVTIVAEGTSLEVALNGRVVWRGVDDTFTAGSLAVSAGLARTIPTGEARVAFEGVRVTDLP